MIAEYVNGNYTVKIFEDGTKIREGKHVPAPEYPESIDIKITNYCSNGGTSVNPYCFKHCHEQSNPNGKHGKVEDIFSVVKGLPRGVEMAIGGGNPLTHPDLIEILKGFREFGLISNLTVNSSHLVIYEKILNEIKAQKLIYGLGISYISEFQSDIERFRDENTIVHVIAGVHNSDDIIRFLKIKPRKVLILGYKETGNGKTFHSVGVDKNIGKWKSRMGTVLSLKDSIISFDNLGLKQLNVKSWLSKKDFIEFFMGDDGKYSFYLDMVKNEYCISSTSKTRFKINDATPVLFKNLQNLKKE